MLIVDWERFPFQKQPYHAPEECGVDNSRIVSLEYVTRAQMRYGELVDIHYLFIFTLGNKVPLVFRQNIDGEWRPCKVRY